MAQDRLLVGRLAAGPTIAFQPYWLTIDDDPADEFG